MKGILYIEAVSMFNSKTLINLTVALLLVTPLAFSQDLTPVSKASNSIGGIKNLFSKNNISKDKLLEHAISTKRAQALKGLSRAHVVARRQQKPTLASSLHLTENSAETSNSLHHSFSIYNAYSQLVTDIDADGYYQTFSVTFDADLLSPIANQEAFVYADLYLSQNGGPWTLYFSTDNFVINGEDTADEFEVVTQLDSGYVPEHYDVLIDLYEVGYSDVVATYSSNDSNALYALPLESSDYDPEYVEVDYHEEHGGGSSWLLISALLLFVPRWIKTKT